jgi:hypothetical protein
MDNINNKVQKPFKQTKNKNNLDVFKTEEK